MKTMKSVIALLLAAVLCLALFTACAKTEEPAKSDSTPSSTTPAKTDTAPGQAKEETPVDFDEEPVELIYYQFDMRGTGNDYGGNAKQAAHDYVLEKLNIDLDMHFVTSGDWTNSVSVALSAGERIDVCTLFSGTRIGSVYPKGLLMDITDLMAEYGPEVSEITKDYIGTYTYGGRIFGVPTIRNYAKNGYILLNGEMLEEIGMTEAAENMKSWSDYEAVMKVFKEKYGDANGIYATRGKTGDWICNNYSCLGDSFDSYVLFDNLGDGQSVVYSDMDGNVSLYQEQPGWVNEAKIMADWMNKGYVWPDSPITTEFVDDTMKQKLVFSFISGSEFGVDVVKSNSMGFKVVAVQTVGALIKTSQPSFSGIGIPVTAEEPEAAMKFINLMYSDSTLMNYITWGVEGVDYELVDGQVKHHDGTDHYTGVDFIWGNSFLLIPLYGNGPDFYERVQEINATSAISPYMGFALDVTDLDGILSQISAVNDQFLGSFQGGLYTDALYEEYLEKMKAAEVDKYLSIVQDQLNAWIAANK